jgi:hypothetical protein
MVIVTPARYRARFKFYKAREHTLIRIDGHGNRIYNDSQPPWPKREVAIVPSPEAQRAWYCEVLPVCQACPDFLGEAEIKPENRIVVGVRCNRCQKCGGRKVINPLDDCPLGKFKRLPLSTLNCKAVSAGCEGAMGKRRRRDL